MDGIVLIMMTFFIISAIAVIVLLNLINVKKNRKLKILLDKLEVEKNIIDSAPISPELAEVEAFLSNEKLGILYNDWKERLNFIKSIQIPKITDMLIEADYSLSQMDYKSTIYKIARLEMEIYKVRTNSQFLLNEIKDITTGEEKNRAIITKLKAVYRELLQKFIDNKDSYGPIRKSIKLQFENIAKRFDDFEIIMDNNEYTEVTQLLRAIDDMLKHMNVVIEEVPAIVLLLVGIIPKKIDEVLRIYDNMIKDGYPLDYLNVEYNIEEANKKLEDIASRSVLLNLEDCLFELKVLADYFDSLFDDFEKEKINRNNYEEVNRNFESKLKKTNKLVDEIYNQMDKLKNIYNLSKERMNNLKIIHENLEVLNSDYKLLMESTSNNTFAYSKLTKEIEGLSLHLAQLEESLDLSLNTIGNMREDEVRARQQLEEIKTILKEAKSKVKEYNLPVIPDSYYVEVEETHEAIREIIKELDKKPITISVLNTRVDTARDLVLKLYGKTREMMKSAMLSEMAIVYGNRYRSNEEELDKQLLYSEGLFFKGEYQKSLEMTINSLNRIEPGIYEKLIDLYPNDIK